jgi:uncharacterized protein (TIRG00374 family)
MTTVELSARRVRTCALRNWLDFTRIRTEMSPAVKKWAMFAIRWGIAVAGICYVVVKISWRDQVLVLDPDNHPVKVRLAVPADENAASVKVLDAVPGYDDGVVPTRALVNEPDRSEVELRLPEGVKARKLLAVDLSSDLKAAERVLVEDPLTGKGEWHDASQVAGGYVIHVPYPLIQAGLGHMLQKADPVFLWGAIAIFPLTYLITGLRWYWLLKALDVHLGLGRAFVINMVGGFYNTFMPGSTGGDVLKAYYAAKHTHYRTRAVMSVIVDRAIGLIALIMLGGAMASLQWREPAARRVALGAVGMLGALALGLFIFYTPVLRRAMGLGAIRRRLPMQRQVDKAVETMHIYRRRPWVVLGSLFGSLPVHMTVVLSAMFAGMAFDLPLRPQHYWVIVPVVVLAGSIPISPQGAGVMEFFAIMLTRSHGCTVAQAFALTMSIRIVQILWNLTGGIFVLRGGYHAPTQKEQAEQEAEEVSDDVAPGKVPAPSSTASPKLDSLGDRSIAEPS